MPVFFKKILNNETIIVFSLYLIFLIIGIFSYKDFGVSVDEWETRILGFANLKYICDIFFENIVPQLNLILKIPELSDYHGTHGAIIALPSAYIEYIFGIKDSQNYFLLRHYLNHLVFLISNFYFYFLVKERFSSWKCGILGAVFMFFTPRIFAESFYNPKDIIFLSMFIISLYYGINFYKSTTIKNAVLFAITTALSIDIRIMGIIIVPIITFLTLIKNLKNKKIFLNISIYISLLIFFTILFWPYLWSNPLLNFLKVFKTLGSFGHEGYNFYLGKYHLSSNVPWHYSFVWILITTPILYIFLFFYGFINYVSELYKVTNNYFETYNIKVFFTDKSKGEDLIYFSLLLLPLLIVIVLDSTLYTGWRHLYFIYPCFLIFSIKGLLLVKKLYFSRWRIVFTSLISIFIFQIVFTMAKIHPHQNVYFNFLAGNKVERYFEMDYWGLANKQAFEYIIKNDVKNIIKIGSGGSISLENSKAILDYKSRERIIITKNKEADYIIDNYINWFKYKRKRYEIPANFNIYKEIKVSGNKIISIYKNNN
jgi:hypothetical protein